MHKFLFGAILIFGFQSINAQTLTITGTVVDEANKESIIGANILIDQTSTGTVTDLDGKFELEVNQGDVLIVSYTGFVDRRIPITSNQPLLIELDQDNKLLDE